MFQVQIHLENRDEIIRLLEASGKKAKPLLKKAVNQTARRAKKSLYKQTKRTYTIKQTEFSEKNLELKRATNSGEAQIKVYGSPLSLPKGYQIRKNGRRSPAKAAIKRGSMKPIEAGGIKGFLAVVKRKGQTEGHKGIFQRKGTARNPIRESKGPAISKLTEMTFKKLQGEVEQNLQESVWHMIDELFK